MRNGEMAASSRLAIAAIACRGSKTSTRASRRLRGGIRITRRYSHHHLARGAGPHALVDDAGRPATRLHVYARPWDLGSERFESVHSVYRAQEVGSLHDVLAPAALRPFLIKAVQRGMARELERWRGENP